MMANDPNMYYRSIPSMDELLVLPWVASLEAELGREAVKDIFNEVLADFRRRVRNGDIQPDASTMEMLNELAQNLMNRRARASLCSVVNATGVVVHTNLGRSPLPQEALDAVLDVSRGYSTLEYSLESGSRGQRNAHVEWLLCRMTGAEAAIVVNNNAGAVLLALAATARDREVVVSRGEMVEIGGSFRIPDILAFSGAKMTAVGCTNYTHLRDYADAVTENTSLLLKVHPSNFRIEGFTESVSREELAGLAKSHGLIVMEDLGSGLLEDMDVSLLEGEQTVRRCIEAGVDIVTFSGDKLLGGPQIGCIAGSRELIDKMRGNQLLRALRVDKMTLAAFEAILRMYLKGKSGNIPTMDMLRVSDEELEEKARALMNAMTELLGELSVSSLAVELVETDDAVGGGSFPGTRLPGWGVSVASTAGIRAEKLAARLRETSVPIVTGIRADRLVFHVRTLLDGDCERIVRVFREIYGESREA